MEKQSFWKRFLFPALPVLVLAGISFFGYFSVRQAPPSQVRQMAAGGLGLVYFLSVSFGAFYVYTVSCLNGASLGERILAAGITPFAWMTKEVLRLTESHPFSECLYYYLNPLNFWLVSLMVLQMGAATLLVRPVLKRRGYPVSGSAFAPVFVVLASLAAVIGAYAWGKGENLYVIFLEGYRMLFGSGL